MEFSELYNQPRKYYSYTNRTFDGQETLDVEAVLKRNGIDGYVVCDGAGDITVEISGDGTNFDQEILLKKNERLNLINFNSNAIRVTSVSLSAYRVLCL
jgi:hypothetical protein